MDEGFGSGWRSPLVVAVPGAQAYDRRSGIGRVFHSLRARWGGQVRVLDARLERYALPVLRNFPWGVRVPAQADVVLLPQLTGARALRNTRGTPSVVIVHDMGAVDFPGDRLALDWLTCQSLLHSVHGLRQATRIVTVSRFTRDRLVQRMPYLAERVHTVPNGVDEIFLGHRRSAAESRQRVAPLIGLPGARPLVLSVGSEAPRKNIGLLLRVFSRVKTRFPSARLIRVGRPGLPRWRAETLGQTQALGLRPGSDVVFLDAVADDSTLADLYAAADVYVSTSLYEGFGLPALEALAVGTPVVVTRCGAFPEVVGEAGRIVEAGLEPLARAVGEALADGPCEGRSLEGRARAATFSWARAAGRYLEIMRQARSETSERGAVAV